ncbi:helix-turn-helix transcriptional regulator [Prevotellamassilia timonensis]|uniref:helix-turn-helix transcriptional regulator n=1 Tax=Prevotellamassilia timonensis TaxID=1852370 RepID=UPI00259AC805|nr:response regulator transcription factor [uncultured Prevotellamassilia sp.]
MIIIADNQPLTRDALTTYLAGQPLRFAGNKAELAEALQAEPEALVVLDFTLFDFATPEQLLIYLRRFAHVHWLLLSAEFAEGLLRLFGAEPQVSFITKDCTRTDVVQAVYRISNGGREVCPSVSDVLRARVTTQQSLPRLTSTEMAILTLMAEGLTAKEIAARRNSSVHTIVTHKKNLFRKLGVSTAYEAVRYALRAGLADPVEYYI